MWWERPKQTFRKAVTNSDSNSVTRAGSFGSDPAKRMLVAPSAKICGTDAADARTSIEPSESFANAAEPWTCKPLGSPPTSVIACFIAGMAPLRSLIAGPHGIQRFPNLATRRATAGFTVPLTQMGMPPGCTGLGIWRMPSKDSSGALPADTHAKVDATAGQRIHSRQLLGQHGRTSQCREQDSGGEPNTGGGGGYRRQEDEGFQPVAVRTGRLSPACGSSNCGVGVGGEVLTEHDVVGHHDPVHAGEIHGTRRRKRCSPVVVRVVAEGSQIQRDLRTIGHIPIFVYAECPPLPPTPP